MFTSCSIWDLTISCRWRWPKPLGCYHRLRMGLLTQGHLLERVNFIASHLLYSQEDNNQRERRPGFDFWNITLCHSNPRAICGQYFLRCINFASSCWTWVRALRRWCDRSKRNRGSLSRSNTLVVQGLQKSPNAVISKKTQMNKSSSEVSPQNMSLLPDFPIRFLEHSYESQNACYYELDFIFWILNGVIGLAILLGNSFTVAVFLSIA